MNFWFGAFLFGGFLIPFEDLYWPFKLFYYIMPYSYYTRSAVYELFEPATFEPCDPLTSNWPVCTPNTDGLSVLDSLSQSFPLFSTKDYTTLDTIVLVCIGLFYKIMFVVGVFYKTSQVAKIHDEPLPADLYNNKTSSQAKETPAVVATSLATERQVQEPQTFARVEIDA